MRHLLTSVVLLVFLFPAVALGQGVTMDDLVERNGLYYEKFTNVPFTGTTTGKIQGSFKNGKEDGPWVRYHDNGQLAGEGTYKDGEKDGPWVHYWDNRGLWHKGSYKDGQNDGPWIEYWENGQLHWEGTFKDGKMDGPWIFFHVDGTVNEEWTGTYKNDVKVE